MKEYKESLFDLMLTYASKELVDEIVDKYPDPEELKGKYEFSPEFEKWAEDLMRKEKKRTRIRKHKNSWQIALIIVKKGAVTISISFALFALMAFAVPSIRVTLANYFIQQNEKHIGMELQDSSEEIQDNDPTSTNYVIPYLPKGFEITEEVDTDNLLVIQYINENDEAIRFERHNDTVTLTIDSEESGFEQVIISNYECYVSSKNGINTIIFNTENYGYIISAEISIDELIKIAESILK